MLTFKIDLVDEQMGRLKLQMPNGDVHYCSEDFCDCAGTRYGSICKHRLFIFAMGGFDELAKLIRSERRKQEKAAKAKDAPTSGGE